MRNLLKLFCLTLIVFSSCKPDDKEDTLSPPIIDRPLFHCATTVSVSGFMPGAKIEIYVNGSTIIGGGVSDSPWGQVFSVSPVLNFGDVITATQTFDGVTSLPSQPLTVEHTEKYFGGSLPKPKLDEPIYNCGGAIGVSNLAKGGYLRIYSDGVEVGHVDGCGQGQWLNVNPVFATGKSVTADVKLCTDVSPLSVAVLVSPEPTFLPQLEIGDVYEYGKYCNIYNITNGARVKTFNGSNLVDDQYYSGGGQIVRLSPQVMPGDILTATQELCNIISDPSDPSVVKPCSEMPAPSFGPICPGDKSVKIIDGVLGAHIKVYCDGVLAANGGGNEIMLFAPAKNGENYQATQRLGSCISPTSVAIAVGCDEPINMKPEIPNAGRAVAVAVDPSDDNRIVVASETGGLFRSTDKGKNWEHISGTTTFRYSDVTYLSFKKDVIIATAREDTKVINGGGIWRSTDNGNTWEKVSLITPNVNNVKSITGYCLSVDKDSKRVWAGTSWGLAYSNNDGKNWKFQAVVPDYNNDETFSVETPDANRIVIVTSAGIKVSLDGGLNFATSMNGIPNSWRQGDHNQIAIAPNDPDHIYWAFYHIPKGNTEWNCGVFMSTNFGVNWNPAYQEKTNTGRPLFVRTAEALNGNSNNYSVYWGNGTCAFKRTKATTGSLGTIGTWDDMAFDHCDPSDVGFEDDQKTPLILLSDGGLHLTQDQGKNWKLAGGGPYGYNALQITEVTGQLHENDGSADLYFGTQDNDIWASPDLGISWVKNRCCEGFFLNIMRNYYPPDQTRLTGVSCAGCVNFISGALLDAQSDFKNPQKNKGNPRLLKPGFYIQNTYPYDSIGSLFMLTQNTGTSWDSSYVFLQDTKDLSKVSGSLNNPVIFTAFKAAGVTPSGQENLNIKRITGVLSPGGTIVSDITGFGSLGVFPTMFAWYKPFGVDPNDPNFIILADIVDNFMKVTIDGGSTWFNDYSLTDLITGNGEFDFNRNNFTQFSCIGFDPDCSDHILVGTQQAGIFVTYNHGKTWGKIYGTEKLPYVSSFFFPGGNRVIISTYGRGLWSLKYNCNQNNQDKKRKSLKISEPFILHGKARIALSSIKDPSLMPDLGYFLVQGGDIIDYSINEKTFIVEELVITSGKIQGYNWEGKIIKVPFKVRMGDGQGKFGGDEQVSVLVRENSRIKGLLLESNKFKGPIFSDNEINLKQLPKQAPPKPYISIMNGNGGFPTIEGNELIEVTIRNFNPKLKLEIYLNGEPVKLNPEPKLDGKGSAKLKIPQILDIGGHTLLVKQHDKNKVLQDVATFTKHVRDEQ
jgi:photosystem II stability/assembly factor-like uncharacterized protein